MARRRRRQGTTTGERDDFSVATGFSVLPRSPIGDRRLWHPLGVDAPPVTRHGLPARFDLGPVLHGPKVKARARTLVFAPRIQAKRKDQTSRLREVWSFRSPAFQSDAALVCVRRKIRKQVLHALKRTGKGGSFRKRPRRSKWSNVQCR